MEAFDPGETEQTTQYLSDDDGKIFDWELGEEVDVILETDAKLIKSVSAAPPPKTKSQDEFNKKCALKDRRKDEEQEETKIPSKSDVSTPTKGKPADNLKFDEKYKLKLCPTYATYLSKKTEIPKHILTAKYLSKNLFEKVILTSYPRSGNTLLRKYLEDITGIITGSDWDVRRKLNYDLVEMGMRGEGKVNHKVWIIKSHYPERYGFTKFDANKCILLVRNPMDAIISLYNMVATGTHNCSMSEDDHKEFNPYFDMFISQEISVWRDFHSYWMDPDPMIPTFIVRYEDLLSDPKETLMSLFSFLLNEKSLTGTLIEALIDKHTKKDEKKEVYKPRVGKINANKKKYTKSQISQIKQLSGQMLRRMGYIKGSKTSLKNNTGFYSDDDDVALSHGYECDSLVKYGKLQQVNMRYRYDEYNQKTLEDVCKESYRDSVKHLDDLPSVEVNYNGDLIRQRTARDPMGRGSRVFKETLRGNVDIIDPDGNVTKAKRKVSKKM